MNKPTHGIPDTAIERRLSCGRILALAMIFLVGLMVAAPPVVSMACSGGQACIDVRAHPYGAVGNGQSLLAPITIARRDNRITVDGAAFTSADTGKILTIEAPEPGVSVYQTTISNVINATQVQVTPPLLSPSNRTGQIYRVRYGTDDSHAIQAAYDAAVATGVREVFFPASTGDYFAPNLGAVWNASFVGEGRLSGTYKRQVASLRDTSRGWFPSDTHPASQLAHLNAAMAASTRDHPAIVVVVGTSRSTVSATRTEDATFHGEVRRRLRAEFPAAYFQVIDRGIGASTTSMLNGASIAGATVPSWYTALSEPWLPTYVEPLRPDAVFALIGINDGFSLRPEDLRGFVGTIQSWDHKVDVVLCPDNNASMQAQPSGEAQEGTDYAAGLIESYARKANLALVDVYRLGAIFRDGYDPGQPIMEMGADFPPDAVPGAPLGSLPVVLPPTRDFAIAMRNLVGYDFWKKTPLTVQIGNNPANTLVLEQDPATGHIAYTVNLTDTVTSVPRTVSAQPAPQGGFYLEIDVQGSDLRVSTDQANPEIYSGLVERFGGTFVPALRLTGGATTGATLSWSESRFQPRLPRLLDRDVYGDATKVVAGIDPVLGGNGFNHLSVVGVRAILGGALDLSQFAE